MGADDAKAFDAWPDMTSRKLTRAEIEKQLARGVRRTLEVLAPSALLTAPTHRIKKLEHGELRWVEGQRVALLQGSPDQIGQAHGKLLKLEAVRCIDSVMYAFGTAQTILTGRWFREDLEKRLTRSCRRTYQNATKSRRGHWRPAWNWTRI